MTTARAAIRLGIVDTDSGLLTVLAKRLQRTGWQRCVFASPVPPDTLVAMRLDALVIDLDVLGPQAWPYLETVCERLPLMAVLVCTGRSTVAQRVRALRFGADDWIGKPCHPEELIARVEAVVRRRRRAEAPEAAEPLIAGGLEIRPDMQQVLAGAVAADLTRREFELIGVLVEAEGQVLRREEIYERVWGYAMVHGDRSVDVFIRKLRQKLEHVSPGALHPHSLRHRLPLHGRIGRRRHRLRGRRAVRGFHARHGIGGGGATRLVDAGLRRVFYEAPHYASNPCVLPRSSPGFHTGDVAGFAGRPHEDES